ncbi:MAG TPA: L,D-transpeptidase [Streptosporangiaceae bacterium]|nr:L,D-transpeptidase [Streptosporangiaceae bacterium]
MRRLVRGPFTRIGRRGPRAGSGALAALCAGVLAVSVAGCGAPGQSAAGARVVGPVRVSGAELARLPRATTYTKILAAPLDSSPSAVTGGLVVHPHADEVLYAGPGKPPVGVLPATELGSPTWVPVVQQNPGWDRVLLPDKPNGATGWIYTGASGPRLDTARTGYLVRIWVGARKLSLYDNGKTLGTWTVAVGAPGTVTPTGRTFILALLSPDPPTYSPLILPLGFHSATLDTFGGGPGTVALHGWPDPSVFGQAISHGCVRVPATALSALSKVPLGSLVLISS